MLQSEQDMYKIHQDMPQVSIQLNTSVVNGFVEFARDGVVHLRVQGFGGGLGRPKDGILGVDYEPVHVGESIHSATASRRAF